MKKIPFWLSLIIIPVVSGLIILGSIYGLDSYTSHGNETEVPDVAKKKMQEAIKILEAKGFDVIVDSTYRDTLPPFYVIKQFPESGEMVKSGRTIQLIVNKGTAPTVEMPALLGVSVPSAIQYLERSYLKLGDTIFKPDFAVGRILQQLVNGKDVKAGTLLAYGTKVTLVIGSGLGREIYNYPDFYGMTLGQAYKLLDTLGLSRGAIIVDKGTKDSMKAYIYKQNPPAIEPFTNQPTLILQGNVVEFWVSDIRKPREIDTTAMFIGDSTLSNAKRDDIKSSKGSSEDEEDEVVDEKGVKGVKTMKKKKKLKPTTPKPTSTKPPKAPTVKQDDGY
jgi:eukaryotic-like serine/threonine-protein kinase